MTSAECDLERLNIAETALKKIMSKEDNAAEIAEEAYKKMEEVFDEYYNGQ